MSASFRTAPRARQGGFNLIELMIAMLLGLLVLGAAIGIFLSNRVAYQTTEGMSRIQESARTSFEMIARNVREAGGNACDVGLPVVNVLSNPTANWWSDWAVPVKGYDDGSLTGSKAGTDAIQLMSASAGGATVSAHTPASQALTLAAAAPDLHPNAIMLLCDRQQVAVLQVDSVSGTDVSYGSASLNACTRLGRLPGVCVPGSDNYGYEVNSLLTELRAVRWYVADNGRGGTSLYQTTLGPGGTTTTSEISEGVSNLQLQYLLAGTDSYVDGSAGLSWANVVAVKMDMAVTSLEKIGTDKQPITRHISTIISIRNRNT